MVYRWFTIVVFVNNENQFLYSFFSVHAKTVGWVLPPPTHLSTVAERFKRYGAEEQISSYEPYKIIIRKYT